MASGLFTGSFRTYWKLVFAVEINYRFFEEAEVPGGLLCALQKFISPSGNTEWGANPKGSVFLLISRGCGED